MKKIGFVTDIAFWEIGNGQNARIRALYDFLNAHSHLTLYFLGEEPSPLPGPGFASQEIKSQLASLLKEAKHDLLIVEKLHLDWVAECANAPIYLDAHDLISSRAQSFQEFHRFYDGPSWEEEMTRFKKFDKVIFLQNEEMEKTAGVLGKERTLLCPHPVICQNPPRLRKNVEAIGFFGGPSWPNVDSLQWLHDKVLPLLGDLSQKCSAQGAIVCSPFSNFSPHLAKGQIFSSLDRYYHSIDIALNPALYGSGLKIKTVEAIAYGIPLVTTTIGAQGLKELDGKAFLIADRPEEFAEAIQHLAASPSLRQEISHYARCFARQHFTPEACFSSLLSSPADLLV